MGFKSLGDNFLDQFRQKVKTLNNITINIGSTTIAPSPSVRNLGVIFDQTLTLEKHVNNICRTCYMHLRNISKVRKYLSQDATKSLVHALVMSRLDYANVLLYGLPEYMIAKLQKVQNTCARITMRTPRRDHISPILRGLHWLPVRERLQYKVLLYVYKGLNGLAPSYIMDMVKIYTPTRSLRSNDKMLLTVPVYKSATYGKRTFSYCAAELWNPLPLNLKMSPSLNSFKSQLKTFLFK